MAAADNSKTVIVEISDAGMLEAKLYALQVEATPTRSDPELEEIKQELAQCNLRQDLKRKLEEMCNNDDHKRVHRFSVEQLSRLPQLGTPLASLEEANLPWVVLAQSTLCWVGPASTEGFYTLDLPSCSSKLVEGPSMAGARQNPAVLAFERRLYVLGGDELEGPQPWGEFYDLDVGSWQSFPGPIPPKKLWDLVHNADFWGAIHPKDIIVGQLQDLYHLDLVTWDWKNHIVPDPPLVGGFHGTGVPCERNLLWFTKTGLLVAYNLDSKKWLRSKGLIDPAFENIQDWESPPVLAHIDANLFCLIWVDILALEGEGPPSAENGHPLLHCLRFTVSVSPPKNLVSTKVLGCECQAIPRNCYVRNASVV